MPLTPTEFIDTYDYKLGTVIDGIRYVPDGQDVDCDDYAWTLLVLIEGGQVNAIKALASGRAELWRVRSPVNGKIARHVALWHVDYGWSDSTYPRWRDLVKPHFKVRKMRLITTIPLVLWGKWPGKLAAEGKLNRSNYPFAEAITGGWW